MKVLLVQPPLRDVYHTSGRTQPLGLAYLAASLRAAGHDVRLLDAQTERKEELPFPPELSHLKEHYPAGDRSPWRLYGGYFHFGMGWDEVRDRIFDSGAEVVGISSNFTPYHQEALEVARLAKAGDPSRVVVMGGAHASCDPAGVLASPRVDYVVLAEGEVRFPRLLEAIQSGDPGSLEGIDGIGYRKGGEIRVHPVLDYLQDLDCLAPPARDLLDPDRYRIGKRRAAMILTSRGCPHGCAYCSGRLVTGTAFRPRSAEAVVAEMADCRDRYGIEAFDFEDDNFTFDRDRARRLLRLIIATFGERSLALSAMNGVSFAALDRELLELMRQAGFNTVNLSCVTTRYDLREQMRRPGREVDFGGIVEEARTAGLGVIAYAILGLPGQTLEEMVETLIYLMGLPVLIGPSVYYPTPGTPLFERCREEAVLPPHPSQWRSSAFPVETEAFSRLDLVTLFRLVRLVNFFKGRVDKGQLPEGSTWETVIRQAAERNKRKTLGPAEASCREERSGRRRTLPGKDLMPWKDLLGLFFTERIFYGLRKGPSGNPAPFALRSSRKVIDLFLEKAWRLPLARAGFGGKP
jgi:anaerobic magnesium-protoporphyrin IX monomethyl ester cyclase